MNSFPTARTVREAGPYDGCEVGQEVATEISRKNRKPKSKTVSGEILTTVFEKDFPTKF